MNATHLHIVSFDIPYPPNYGGAIEVFYRIKALSEAGVHIHLHCFTQGREPSKELEALCASVDYYERNKGLHLNLGIKPFIVLGRKAPKLKTHLLEDDHPILFEGLHTCYLLSDPELQGRTKMVRMHNIEQDYYRGLASADTSFFMRAYHELEAIKLEKFERDLQYADKVLAISRKDHDHFQSRFGNSVYIPPFHPFNEVTIGEEEEKFAFYHGNLEVPENANAARFLVNKVFQGIDEKLLIAGNDAPKDLIEAANQMNNVEITGETETGRITELVQKARINILATFQATGVKLKLLTVLFNGRHCLVNSPLVKGTGLEDLCRIADSPVEFRYAVKELMETPFEEKEYLRRKERLEEEFDNQRNARLILDQLERTHGPSHPHT